MAPDLHPEELLDKAAAGTLSASEWSWLESHLASCDVCRFTQQLTADFAQLKMPELDVERLVAGAVAKPAVRGASRRLGRWVAMAAMLTTAVSFAAVGQWSGVLPKLVKNMMRAEQPPAPLSRDVPRPVVTKPVVEAVAEQPAPSPTAVTPVAVPSRRVTKKVAAPTQVLVEAGAAELFAQANEARARGEREEAMRRYRELLAKFASSDEARLTRATLGRLLLDGGDARGALEQLEPYLASGDGLLREDAMAAKARALGVLGRGDEAEAWDDVLREFPDSVFAGRAEQRLKVLRGQ